MMGGAYGLFFLYDCHVSSQKFRESGVRIAIRIPEKGVLPPFIEKIR